MQENYLSHPTFGLLYSLCTIDERQAIYTTLYAQRLFFRVTSGTAESPGFRPDLIFDPITRNEARQALEEQIRFLRRANRATELTQLQAIYKQTFT